MGLQRDSLGGDIHSWDRSGFQSAAGLEQSCGPVRSQRCVFRLPPGRWPALLAEVSHPVLQREGRRGRDLQPLEESPRLRRAERVCGRCPTRDLTFQKRPRFPSRHGRVCVSVRACVHVRVCSRRSPGECDTVQAAATQVASRPLAVQRWGELRGWNPHAGHGGPRGSHRSAPRLPAEVQVLRPARHQQSLATCVSPGSSVTRLRHAAVEGSLGSRRRLSPHTGRGPAAASAPVLRIRCRRSEAPLRPRASRSCDLADTGAPRAGVGTTRRPRACLLGPHGRAVAPLGRVSVRPALLGLTHSAHTRVCVWRSVPVRRTRQDTDQGPSRRLLTPQLSPRDGESVFHPADSSFPECSVSGVLHSSGPRPLWHL